MAGYAGVGGGSFFGIARDRSTGELVGIVSTELGLGVGGSFDLQVPASAPSPGLSLEIGVAVLWNGSGVTGATTTAPAPLALNAQLAGLGLQRLVVDRQGRLVLYGPDEHPRFDLADRPNAAKRADKLEQGRGTAVLGRGSIVWTRYVTPEELATLVDD
jgi:hypothetical protein